MMKKTKEIYSQPTTKVLVVRFGGLLCQSNYTRGGGGVYNIDEINDNGDY